MTETLESVQQARSAFENEISVLAHDLAGPLGRIINCMHLIKDLVMMGEVNAVDQVADIALSTANAQLNSVAVLAETTRLANGMRHAAPRPTSLQEMLHKVLPELAPMAGEAHVNIETDITDDFPPVMAEDDTLRRILYNLLDNALRHVPDSGVVRLWAVANNDVAEIYVADNGKGVAPEHREKIFERYFRVQGSAVRGKRGMGLGLLYVRLAAATFGGTVSVDDNPGGGALFCLKLPLKA